MSWPIDNNILIAIAVAIGSSITIEVLPQIKLRPWSALFRFIGRAVNVEVMEKFKDVDEKIDGLGDRLEDLESGRKRDKAEVYRVQILRFGDEILHGIPHSKEHFDETIRNIARYDEYCKEHPDFENGVTCMTSLRIKAVYRSRLEKNDFLGSDLGTD